MCSPRKQVTKTVEDVNELGKTAILLNVCECYIESSQDNLHDDPKKEILNLVKDENEDADSLVNETGSCQDENEETSFWNEKMFSEDDSIYNVLMPKSFYELNETESTKKNTTGFVHTI